MIIFISLLIYFRFKKQLNLKLKKRFHRNKKITTFSKSNLNNWMNLSKKERYCQQKEDSTSYLNKRKVLLEEIRDEYKKISKGKIKKT